MKKCWQFLALLLLPIASALHAQTIFTAPDVVCVNQPVQVNSKIFDASSYYWGFCSGNIGNTPIIGTNLGAGFQSATASNIEIVQDKDGQYYGFSLNAATRELIRLNYGNSLNNIPTVTNFGNLTNGLPVHPTSLYIIKDPVSRKWYIFVSGGYYASESTVGRVDFDSTLSNPTPNVANFGNLSGNFDGPKGLFVGREPDGHYFGYLVNRFSNELIKLDFRFNISNTPITTNMGNVDGVLNFPTDMAGIFDQGEWYLFVTNRGDNTVARINLGTSLNSPAPTGVNLGNFLFRILEPSSISLTRDCGSIYAYITDSSTSQLVSLEMPNAAFPTPTAVAYSVVGGMNFPSSISSILRDQDNLYAFITNTRDETITRININACNNSSIPSFTEVTPPVYFYDTAGTYTVYYVIDQGLPTMQVECKEITVLPIPTISLTPELVICKGQRALLYAISNTADSFAWSPVYNLDTVFRGNDTLIATPDYSIRYHVSLYYPNGCIVDTSIKVNVVQVNADAGPDRTIADGATTTIGGPMTSLSGDLTYSWSPNLFISGLTNPFPVVNPPYDIKYYLEVTELNSGLGCKAYDTVAVKLNCGDAYLPNAFTPNSTNTETSRFGILNKQIAQLNYFRIFDRWGNPVFETKDPTQRWDGTNNGQPSPVGVYTWIVDGFCISGKAVKQTGNVTLLK
jgi:gliding motility-associated-like protein